MNIRILLALTLFAAPLCAEQSQTPYEVIANHLLKSVNTTERDEKTNMTAYDRYSAALRILHQAVQHDKQQPRMLSDSAIEDVQLFFYNPLKPDFTVLNHIKRTRSTLGTCALAKILITPLTDPEDLEQRRNSIMQLMRNKPLYVKAKTLLERFKKLEPQLLTLWNANDAIYGKNMKETFFDPAWSKSSRALGASALMSDTFNLTSWLIGFAIAQFFISCIKSMDGKPGSSPASMAATLGLSILMSGTNSINTMRNRMKLMALLRKRLASINTLKHLILDLESVVEEYHLVNHAPFLDSLYSCTHLDKEMRSFLTKISGKTFDPNNNYLTSHRGPVLAALPHFLSIRHKFSHALSAIAHLDAYMSIVDLYKEYESQEKSYCFPTYLFGKDRPVYITDGVWHPMLPPEKARASSLYLGDIAPQNIIITGPNAGGKSTNLKAVVLNALFAQTLTIAPCIDLRLTPFHTINTYLNVVDDLGSGHSQHRAEVVRGRQLIEETMALKDNEFVLTTMDEMFRSTVPATGAAASFAVAKGLSKFPNSMLLLATHFGKLTTLPEHTNNGFMNYKVTATKNKDGSFTYPFTLQPGYNHNVIALDLLSYEGFNPKILAYAYDHLNELQGDPSEHGAVAKEGVDAFMKDLRAQIEKELKKIGS